jgi:hypothetical protein
VNSATTRPRLQTAFWRYGILVQSAPLASQNPRIACREMLQERAEFGGGDSCREGLPTVSVLR